MMTAKKRALAAFLCLLLAAGTLSGCANSAPEPASADEAGSSAAEAQAPETEPEPEESSEVRGNLPERDFEGRVFTVYTRSAPEYPQFDAYELVSEELTGEVLNDAIYKRTATVEERFGLKIAQEKVSGPGSYTVQAVKAGDDSVDYTVSHTADVAQSVTSGAFYDLYQGEYFEFDMPWWHATINDSCSFSGRLFMTMNDYLLLYKQQSYCIFFNKGMAADYGLKDHYEAVLDGTWTWDRMYEDMKAVSADADGDGDMDQLDLYGFSCQYGQMLAAVIGCDVHYSGKDENDLPVLMGDSEKHLNALDRVCSVFIDQSVSLLANDYSISESTGRSMWDIPLDTFYAGRALFIGGVVRYAPSIIANCDIDFGILPNPKYDTAQKDYFTYSEVGNSTAILVPVTANLSDVSFVIEAMSEESYNTVVPAYYEVTVKSKYSPDPNASNVLDLMFANHRFDAALLYSWLNVSEIYDTILKKKENTFASLYASRMKVAQKTLDKWVANVEKMGNN